MVKDLTGQKYGMLITLERDHSVKSRKAHWVVECECGTIKTVRGDSLQAGRVKSCGCLKKKQDKKNLSANHSHKQSGTRLYGIWQGMKKRCYNPKDLRFHRYGGRGIEICEDWLDFNNFFRLV